MGSLGAAAFAEQVDEGNVDLDAALTWHVRQNHYPPLPVEYVDVAKRTLAWVNDSDPDDPETWSAKIDLPVGLNPLPKYATFTEVDGVHVPQAEAGLLVKILHLDAFVTSGADPDESGW